MNDKQPTEKPLSPTLRQMLHSVLAAAFGVQSQSNRQRDFNHDKPWHFVLLGIGFTLVFALGLLLIVRLVLYFAAGPAH